MTDFPVLKTSRLLLRQFNEKDLENVFKGLSHPDVIKYYGVSYATIEETEAQMNFFSGLEANKSGRWWAICSTDNKVFFGAGGLNNLNQFHRKAEIGFWLLPEHWGKGIMTEAMPLIVDHGFNDMRIHRIEGFVESENRACKNAMEKLNFALEGRMTECEVKNGKFISLDIYAKLNEND